LIISNKKDRIISRCVKWQTVVIARRKEIPKNAIVLMNLAREKGYAANA
jgi:hypothetical protein